MNQMGSAVHLHRYVYLLIYIYSIIFNVKDSCVKDVFVNIKFKWRLTTFTDNNVVDHVNLFLFKLIELNERLWAVSNTTISSLTIQEFICTEFLISANASQPFTANGEFFSFHLIFFSSICFNHDYHYNFHDFEWL